MKTFIITLAMLIAQSAFASTVEGVLQSKQAPSGVVFEIVTRSDGLRTLIPELRQDIARLRQKFPDLAVAIVSHGSEQFALTRENKKNFSEVHNITELMVKEEQIDIHVCETHAEWRDISAEDFPDFVEVTESGPVKVHQYVQLGYQLIVIN